MLQAASFEPGVAQPESSLLAIRLLMSAAPCIAVLGAVWLIRRFEL